MDHIYCKAPEMSYDMPFSGRKWFRHILKRHKIINVFCKNAKGQFAAILEFTEIFQWRCLEKRYCFWTQKYRPYDILSAFW